MSARPVCEPERDPGRRSRNYDVLMSLQALRRQGLCHLLCAGQGGNAAASQPRPKAEEAIHLEEGKLELARHSAMQTTFRVLQDYREEWALLDKYIREMGTKLSILEAGCGRNWPLKLAGIDLTLVGIDQDAEAMSARSDLSTAIVGDICDPTLVPAQSFDVVYNSFVLEHVNGADRALSNLVSWARPKGLVILRIPDRNSAYGFVSRMTPFWVHVLFMRLIMGFKDSGKPGFGPYATLYEPIVSIEGVRQFCQSHSCEILDVIGHGYYLTYKGGKVAKLVAMTVTILSLGTLPWRHNDLTFVIRTGSRTY